MRLLDTVTGQFVSGCEPEYTVYAILSHTWNQEEGEQTYKELKKIQKRYPAGKTPQWVRDGEYPGVLPPASSFIDPSGRFSTAPVAASPSGVLPSMTSSAHEMLFPTERTALLGDRTSLLEEGAIPSESPCTPRTLERLRLDRSLKRLWRALLLILSPVLRLVRCLCDLYLRPVPDDLQPTAAQHPSSPYTPRSQHSPHLVLEPFAISSRSMNDFMTADSSSIWDDHDLSPKIREACAFARANGIAFIWIDSCCIDQSSSSELSEAINSMYSWYAGAVVCYAFLVDVPPGEDPAAPDSRFRESRWFERTWTLQELIAPRIVIFLCQDWSVLGSRDRLADLVEDITGISREALLREKLLDEFSVAQRLSWAANRQATRPEDTAYSLLGLFDIHLPALYGEGNERAFRRLQEEIMRRIPDQSLFAAGSIYRGPETLLQEHRPTNSKKYPRLYVTQHWENKNITSFFGELPYVFEDGAKTRAIAHEEFLRSIGLSDIPPALDYTFSSYGIRIQLPVIPLSLYLPSWTRYDRKVPQGWYLAILRCEHADQPGHLLGRVCRIYSVSSDVQVLSSGYVCVADRASPERYPRLFALSPAVIARCRPHLEVRTLYMFHPERPADTPGRAPRTWFPRTLSFRVLASTRDALQRHGYLVNLQEPDQDTPRSHLLTLSSTDHTISIRYEYTLDRRNFVEGQLIIVAHIGLVSSASLASPEEAYSADPSTMTWSDFRTWQSLSEQTVIFSAPGDRSFALKLGADFVWASHYSLVVKYYKDIDPTSQRVVSSDSSYMASDSSTSDSGERMQDDVDG